MKNISIFEAAELLLKYGVDEYLKNGVTIRVQFQEVEKILP